MSRRETSLTHVLTLVVAREGGSLTQPLLDAACDLLRAGAPQVLSPGEAADIPCRALDAGELDRLRTTLRELAGATPLDMVLTKARGRRKGLLVADMDSTIVTSETLDDLAAEAGLFEQVAAITKRSMNGEIDFAGALRERVGLLRGLELAALDRVWAHTRLTQGAKTLVATMRAHNALTALVSGGFTAFTARVAALCGFDLHRANVLHDDGAVLTGTVGEPILDRDAKLRTLEELTAQRRLKPAATLAVGDGANDLAMLGAAGLGIAFHAKPIVAAQIANRIDHADLRALLFAQGLASSAFAED